MDQCESKMPISLLLLLLAACSDGQHNEMLVQTWERLSWTKILVLDPRGTFDPGIVKLASTHGIGSRIVSNWDLALNSKNTSITYNGVVEHQDFDKIFRILRQSSPFSMLVIVDTNESLYLLRKHFTHLNKTLGFYVLHKRKGTVLSSLSLKGQDILVENPMILQGTRYKHIYDMQGAHLVSITKSYAPYLTLHECNNGMDCKGVGALVDIFDILGSMFNFSIVLHNQTDGLWGAVPFAGSYSGGDAQFNGALGAVVNELCHIVFITFRERADYMEFSNGLVKQDAATVINRNFPPVDYTLFFRPFTTSSWYATGLVTIMVLMSVHFMPWERYNATGWISHRLAVISGWMLFLLLNAFYGGALTMFFASAPSLPFSSVREGLLLYPKWKMVLPIDEEILVYSLATEVKDKPFVDFYERSKKPDQVEIQPDLVSTLSMLEKPGHFAYSTLEPLLAACNSLGPNSHDVDLQVVSKEFGYTGSVLFHHRSAVAPMINYGIEQLRQSGTLDTIMHKWSQKLSAFRVQDAQVLALGQVSLAHMAFAFVLGVCLSFLVVELAVAKVLNRNKRSQ